ncbi:glycosyl hydrolase family 28-related protein [Oleiharenicola lentus]|uniref:glycosyl hydrolase family 28-related protein n=1 Tax=Oleiharenicola lentus TaxID=2508720 RepID=UPI003F67F8E1
MRLPLVRLMSVFSLMLAGAASALAAGMYRSVADYGANGADERDDTAAIQAAIAAAGEKGAAGGVIFFPAGKYYLSETLIVTQPGLTLLGEGRGASNDAAPFGTLLVLKADTVDTAIVIRDARFSGVRNLAIFRQGDRAIDAKKKSPAILLHDTYHCFIKEVTLASVVSGIELLDGIAPVVEDISIKNISGAFGVWLHGSGVTEGGRRRKVDAAHFVRISGGAAKDAPVEWMILGPNVDGAKVQDARFVAGSRGLVLRGGDAAKGDTRPKYIYADKFGCDHVSDEGVLIEAGNDVFMNNTWIGQNKNASGIVIGPGFTGGAFLTDTRVRGAGGHGLHVMGGQNIYIQNPMIGTNGTNRQLVPRGSTDAAGILIERGVKNLRVTGGGVCPLYESGSSALQHYGVRYLGSMEQAVKDSVRISGVDTTGNPVGFVPTGLSLDAAR